MNNAFEYKLAYEILPALRVSLNKEKTGVLRLERGQEYLDAAGSEDLFRQWKQKRGEKGVIRVAAEEREEAGDIIRRLQDAVRNGFRQILLQHGGLLIVGDSREEVYGKKDDTGMIPEDTDPLLRDRIVVITGAAQGFGKGLARHFARDGACVVVADINRETGEESARELIKETGNPAVVFIPVDVTGSASVDAMIRETVFAFGGLDIFVSNAGVLKAGGLETLEEKDFDFLTSVNYKGLYLGTKYASRVMKTQHVYHPGHFMDIIQINSKSGLQGSNRNFAYAGSKFGSIGLIQSFALELVTENIKVNAVCPGNFFDGPLWSDPEKGLFVQYLRTGKVAGAETVEDVRRHYENLVPMKRGCYVEDVYKAVKYLIDQQYETGQALPVTGGQVMLK